MESSRPGAITELLQAWSGGDRAALDRLMPMVHDELRVLASSRLRRERREHTLQATALINETFLRLVEQQRVRWESRGHFFAVAATCMRRVLVDHARRRRAHKRGDQPERLSLDHVSVAVDPAVDVLDLDAALARLQQIDPQLVRVVELRVFAGCTIEEIAEALGVSASTAKREWRTAQVLLRADIGPPGPAPR